MDATLPGEWHLDSDPTDPTSDVKLWHDSAPADKKDLSTIFTRRLYGKYTPPEPYLLGDQMREVPGTWSCFMVKELDTGML